MHIWVNYPSPGTQSTFFLPLLDFLSLVENKFLHSKKLAEKLFVPFQMWVGFLEKLQHLSERIIVILVQNFIQDC